MSAMQSFLAKYRPVFQIPDSGGGGTTAPSGGNDNGSSPASTTTPSSDTPASPSSGAEGAASDVADFSFIFGDGEAEPPSAVPGQVPPVVKPEVKAQPTSKPAPGAEPPQAASEVKPAPKAGEAGSPVVPTAATSPQPAQAGSGTLDPYDPGAIAHSLQANEAAAIQHVAETLFKLSPEEIEGLETDTVGTIPKLLARSFVKAQYNMFQQLGRIIPNMMVKQTEMMQRHSENEGKFYARWPDVKMAEHGGLVRQYAAVYRQMNPDVTLDKMIEAVGPMVMMAAGITPSLQPQAAPQGRASPMVQNGSRPPQPAPFVPASAVAGGASPQPNALEQNPVEVMFLGGDE